MTTPSKFMSVSMNHAQHARHARHARKAVAVFYHRVSPGHAVRILLVRHVSGDLALPGGSLKGRDFQGEGTDEYARTAERESLEEVAALLDNASEWVDVKHHASSNRCGASESWRCRQMRRQFRELLRVAGPHHHHHVHKEHMEFVTADGLSTTHHVYLVDITRRMRVLYGCESALQRACDEVHAVAHAHPPSGYVRETVGVRFMDLRDALGFCANALPVRGDTLYHVTADVLRRIPQPVWCAIAIPQPNDSSQIDGATNALKSRSDSRSDSSDISDPSDPSELSDDSTCSPWHSGSDGDDGWQVVVCPRQATRMGSRRAR
jgi:hypothetical protein